MTPEPKTSDPKPIKIVTWNINSVRLRSEHVARFVQESAPDILCLQETKCHDDEFPEKAIRDMGFSYLAIAGQKGYHGVAIASLLPFERLEKPDLCPQSEARALALRFPQFDLYNLYVPAGGDIADPESNPKFAHKLAFLDRMERFFQHNKDQRARILVGDLNIAPGEHDVWSHQQLLDVVSHTPVETEALARILEAGQFSDLARKFVPHSEKLFSWWSYRSADWTKNNRGRRLDHIWASGAAVPAFEKSAAFGIHVRCRSWERPSDHVPVEAGFDFS